VEQELPISEVKNLKEPPDKEFMATLAKGLAVIRAFGIDRPRLTLSQAAAAVGLSRATARRVLRTLSQLGYVAQEGREFSLAPRVLELGFAYLAAQSWIDRALPLMKALSDDIAETCSCSALQGSEIICVARAPTRRIMTSAIAIGARLPAWHTAMGRVQLGFLADEELWRRLRAARIEAFTPSTITDLRALFERIKEDRERGFSIVDEELERGLRSISVALTTRRDRPIGAIDVSAHANRTTRNEMRERFLPRLREIARQVAISTD
jgi:IclR family pca regulon transcriptional regulator